MKIKLMEEIKNSIADFKDYHDKGTVLNDSEEQLGKDLFDFVQEFVDTDNDIAEEFASKNGLVSHYKKHCLNGEEKKSTTHTIYYDFDNINDYKYYCDRITSNVLGTIHVVASLFDTNAVLKHFRKLFEGGITIRFSLSCDFRNAHGPVIVAFNAFSSDKTTNYSGGNTINCMILSAKYKTITMYAVDAHYLETKFNNIVKKYTKTGMEFKINND